MESAPDLTDRSNNGRPTVEDVNYTTGPRCLRYWELPVNKKVVPRVLDFYKVILKNKRLFFKMPARGAEIRFWV